MKAMTMNGVFAMTMKQQHMNGVWRRAWILGLSLRGAVKKKEKPEECGKLKNIKENIS